MRCDTLLVSAIVGLFFFAGGCSRKANTPTASSPVGLAKQWEGVEPLVREAGLPGRGSFNHIDVKQVYIKTDPQNLVLFACCQPSVEGAFTEDAKSYGILTIYMDTDGRADTGTPNKETSWHEGLPGSDLQIDVGMRIYVNVLTHKSQPAVSFQVRRWTGNSWGSPVWSADSHKPNGPVAHDKDGIEASIPLATMGLKPGAKVRMLLVENAHFMEQGALKEATFTVAK